MKFRRSKKAEKDYQKSMLPQNRKEVFWDVIKLQWSSLLATGGLMVLFALPLLVLAVFENACVWALMADSTKQQDVLMGEVLALRNLSAILRGPMIVLLSVGLAGGARVVRQLAWEENLFLSYDFRMGIKQNVKQFLLYGLLVGLLYTCASIGWNMASVTQWTVGVVFSAPMWLLVLAVPVLAYLPVVICIYQNGFLGNIRVALALFLKHPVKTVGAVIASFAIVVIPWLIPSLIVQLIGGIVSVALLPFGMLGWFLFAYNRLDETINAQYCPEMVGKGIAKK